MKQPAPKQRLAIYKIALHRIQSNKDEFMCNAICNTYELQFLGEMPIDKYDIDILVMFPEFISQKPQNAVSEVVWFTRKMRNEMNVKTLRIDILNRCIKMTEQIIENEKE